ncbi:MAG: aldehyde ferredoxin oxidoreductase family protein [Candidatus Hermodarchaeota archaeon]|nr:aldehyde ferredoxin oxidoreductase family protein [Candidatus Hermodarchaeota archaeon]
MPNPKGYMGEFLFANLTKGTAERKPLNWDYARDFIGGAGYAARLLYTRLTVETLDPFHPDNEVAIFTGPLTATGAPCTGRHAICTKSALTGIWGESTGGGYFGAELRHTGLDGILITGAAKTPVLLNIGDDKAEIESADHLWGMDTFATEEYIKKETNDSKVRILSIGPAGEKLVRFAAIMNDKGRASARAGAGAVFGAKKLKAITVRGSQKSELADPEAFREHVKIAFQLLENLAPILGAKGTLYGADMLMNLFNDMPVRYFTKPSMDISTINANALDEYRSGQFRCHLCPIGCGPVVTISTDDFSLNDVAGPEYETIGAMGTLCEVDNLALLCQANHLCNLFGLDTISCGSVIALSFAANEHGKLPQNLIGSLKLDFGEGRTLLQLIEMIAHREGLGDILAEGVKLAGEKLGIPELAIHVKGLEVPMHDPRAFFGLATSYAVSPIGAHHMQGDIHTVDMGVAIPDYDIEPGDRHADEGRGIVTAKLRNWRTIFNSLTLCQLALLEPSLVTELYNTATGFTITPDQLIEIGERTMNLKRAFNIRCGITAKDDTMPLALLQPFTSGPNEGKTPNLQMQLKEFYEFSQWDPKTGKPTREVLIRLGLEDVAKDLW